MTDPEGILNIWPVFWPEKVVVCGTTGDGGTT